MYRQSRCDVMPRIVMLLRSDVMFAHCAARRNITSAGNITPKGKSLARKGKHRSKNKRTTQPRLFNICKEYTYPLRKQIIYF